MDGWTLKNTNKNCVWECNHKEWVCSLRLWLFFAGWWLYWLPWGRLALCGQEWPTGRTWLTKPWSDRADWRYRWRLVSHLFVAYIFSFFFITFFNLVFTHMNTYMHHRHALIHYEYQNPNRSACLSTLQEWRNEKQTTHATNTKNNTSV